MAWCARQSGGDVSWVGFNQDQHGLSPGETFEDLDDDIAMAVLQGLRSLRSLSTAVTAIAVPTENVDPRFSMGQRYPMMMSDEDAQALISIVSELAPDAVIAEVGSRLCGSARLIWDHAPQPRRIYCFDPAWSEGAGLADPAMARLRERWDLQAYATQYDFAKLYTKPVPAMRLLKMASPYEIQWWSEPVDMMFEDSSHENPQLRDTLDFWTRWVKPDGIIAGHDYFYAWPDVITEADALAQRLGVQLQVRGTVWWLRKPRED